MRSTKHRVAGALAMVLALELAEGCALVDAVIAARAYVREKIAASRG
jgi:hydroxymethylpyrimidine/phosphomethylpyrimidine kinase